VELRDQEEAYERERKRLESLGEVELEPEAATAVGGGS
jgi:hypothetical protein